MSPVIFDQSIPERDSANWLPEEVALGIIRNEKFPRTGNEDGTRNIRSDGAGTSNKLRPGVQSFVKPASDNEPLNEKESEREKKRREERRRQSQVSPLSINLIRPNFALSAVC